MSSGPGFGFGGPGSGGFGVREGGLEEDSMSAFDKSRPKSKWKEERPNIQYWL